MKHTVRKLIAVLAVGLSASAAHAALVQTTGSGSAVTAATATADFETAASLGASYTEGGLTFTRVGITTNNNGCGYAGCTYAFQSVGFVGNYFYGATTGSGDHYVQIDANSGDLSAIEFIFGWAGAQHGFYWEAFDDNVLVGSGNGVANAGTVFGLSGGAFDRLKFTTAQGSAALTNFSQGISPGIDNVRVQANAIPEPGSIALVGLGLLAAARVRRQTRR